MISRLAASCSVSPRVLRAGRGGARVAHSPGCCPPQRVPRRSAPLPLRALRGRHGPALRRAAALESLLLRGPLRRRRAADPLRSRRRSCSACSSAPSAPRSSTVFFFAILGMEGTYRWLRLRVDEPTAALLVAPVFALSGQFAVAFFRGWIKFFGFELVPWILFGITLAARARPSASPSPRSRSRDARLRAASSRRRSSRSRRRLEAVRALLEQPRARAGRVARDARATASFMATVACVRLWPVAETLLSAPRIMAGTPGHAPRRSSRSSESLAVKDGNIDVAGSFFVGVAFLGARGARRLRPEVARAARHRRHLRVARRRLRAKAGAVRAAPRAPGLLGAALPGALPLARHPLRERARGARARALPLLGEGGAGASARLVLGGARRMDHRGADLGAFERVGKAATLGAVAVEQTSRLPPGARQPLARGALPVDEHRLAHLLGDPSLAHVAAAPRRPRRRGVPGADLGGAGR